jgi:hypothetical protein
MLEPWKEISARKKADQASRIPKEWLLAEHSRPQANTNNLLDVPRRCGVLSQDEIRLTEDYDATSLLELLNAGKLKSKDVTTAFCKRAAIAHQVTNCLTEIFFDEGIKRAEYLDQQFEKRGGPTGPLHGLPISLKDTFKVNGQDASIGFASFAFKPSTEESKLVTLLLNAGAVFYCKTNVSSNWQCWSKFEYIEH